MAIVCFVFRLCAWLFSFLFHMCGLFLNIVAFSFGFLRGEAGFSLLGRLFAWFALSTSPWWLVSWDVVVLRQRGLV